MTDHINDNTTENDQIIEQDEIETNKSQDLEQEGAEDNDESSSTEFEENDAEDAERDSRFKDGQEITLVNVRFPGNARSFPFLLGSKTFHYGQKVVAMSDRGMTVGYINSFPYIKPFEKSMLPLRTISKVATDEDLQKEKDLIAEEKRAERICVDLIERHKLDMNLTHVEFTQFGKKAVFFFTAPNRVDFRSLVKDLVGQLKMRIELRQISVRDRAAALGAIGPCGLQTCCSSFHKNYGNVTIKMAKNQNLALMPNKINGVCGQIKCCIKYEHELYAEKRKKLPKENSLIQALNGDKGKVLKLNILSEEFEMITNEGKIRRYVSSQFQEGHRLPEDWRMPEQFETNIVNETKELIGAPPAKETAHASYSLEDAHNGLQDPQQEEVDHQAQVSENDAQEDVEETKNAPQHQNQQQGQQQRRPHHQQNRPRHQHNQGQQRRPNNNQNQQAQTGERPQGDRPQGQRPHHNNRPRPQGQKPHDPNRPRPQNANQGGQQQSGPNTNKDPKPQS